MKAVTALTPGLLVLGTPPTARVTGPKLAEQVAARPVMGEGGWSNFSGEKLPSPATRAPAPTTNAALALRAAKVLPRALASTAPVIDRAENGYVFDVEGKRYVDFGGGIGVLNTGHRNPRVMARVQDQLEKVMHSCPTVMQTPVYIELAERLCALAPGPTEKKAAFFNSGAEAVENAIKIARAATKRTGVIAFQGGFHGRTAMGMALTGKTAPYKVGMGPMAAGVHHVPYPSKYRGVSEADSLKAIENVFACTMPASEFAAIIIEPVQGEGGFTHVSPEYMKSLRALCDKHGIMLIADEVQSGFGRTGKMFAMEHMGGVEADIMTVAKSMGGGLPISGVIGKAHIMDAPEPGSIGGTYGGNPVACAAALGVLDAFEQDGILERSVAVGDYMRARLEALQSTVPQIGDVRGLGPMLAIELVKDRDGKEPAGDLAKKIVASAREEGLILLACGMHGNTIRILTPVTSPKEVLDEGLDILARCTRKAIAAPN